jgi:hypothetical protein
MVTPPINLTTARQGQIIAVMDLKKWMVRQSRRIMWPCLYTFGRNYLPQNHKVQVMDVFNVDGHKVIGTFGDNDGLIGEGFVRGLDGF